MHVVVSVVFIIFIYNSNDLNPIDNHDNNGCNIHIVLHTPSINMSPFSNKSREFKINHTQVLEVLNRTEILFMYLYNIGYPKKKRKISRKSYSSSHFTSVKGVAIIEGLYFI